MAQMLAPYNNSMRLGQGFNSYTHQICLQDAVLVPDSSKTKTAGSPAPPSEDASNSEGQFTPSSSRLLDQGPLDEGETSEPPDVAQIVSYTARFVDKISEVVDSMNISAALSIQTNTIGGSANGQYIDSDRFKQSDLNYFVQVRVTNQRLDKRALSRLNLVNPVKNAPDDNEQAPVNQTQRDGVANVNPSIKLSPVSINQEKFLEIYGDAFISGWEEGGELNALISIKCKKKSSVTTMKAALEAKLGTPAISGKISGSAELNKSELTSETETTITVNWSGGGQIKDRDILWDVNSLTLAAANFPDQVKKTPQRTYAILSKYTELPEFQNRILSFSPLDYDIAGVYTSALLDMYTDYKSVWKALQITSSEVEGRQTRLEKAKPSADTSAYLQGYQTKYVEGIKKREDEGKRAEPEREDYSAVLRRIQELEDRLEHEIETEPLLSAPAEDPDPSPAGAQPEANQSTNSISKTAQSDIAVWKPGTFVPYEPTLIGLLHAKTDCRLQMIRIVYEVNAIRKDPKIAEKPDASDILAPSMLKQILPVALANKIIDDEWTSWTDTLGTSNADLYKITPADLSKYPAAAKSAAKYADRASHFRLSRYTGVPPQTDASTDLLDPLFILQPDIEKASDRQFIFQNDLEKLRSGLEISSMRVYYDDDNLQGIVIKYTDSTRIKHGIIKGSSKEFLWNDKHVLGVQLAQNEKGAVAHLALSWSNLRLEAVTCQNVGNSPKEVNWSTAPVEENLKDEQADRKIWTLVGFYSTFDTKLGCIQALGIVWGRDIPRAVEHSILPPNLELDYLPENVQKSMAPMLKEGSKWRISDFVGEDDINYGGFFNDLVWLDNTRSDRITKVECLFGIYGGQLCLKGLRFTHTVYTAADKHVTTYGGGDKDVVDKEEWDRHPKCVVPLPLPLGNTEKKTISITGLQLTKMTAVSNGASRAFVGAISLRARDEYGRVTWGTPSIDQSALLDAEKNIDFGKPVSEPILILPPPDGQWSLRGFYGYTGAVMDRMGVIWGSDEVAS